MRDECRKEAVEAPMKSHIQIAQEGIATVISKMQINAYKSTLRLPRRLDLARAAGLSHSLTVLFDSKYDFINGFGWQRQIR